MFVSQGAHARFTFVHDGYLLDISVMMYMYGVHARGHAVSAIRSVECLGPLRFVATSCP